MRSGRVARRLRQVFIYVNEAALARPEVAAFVRFYLEHAGVLAREVGYVPLEPSMYRDGLQKVERAPAPATS